MSTATSRTSSVRDEIDALGPWFHNLKLPDGHETAPAHPLGDFPSFKWDEIAAALPADLSGRRVLDIGCNAGFYSFALAARGAEVLGIDTDPHYLRQARWAAERFEETRVRFRQASVYEVDRLDGPFDIVLFMGVLYHLRHPLLALDLLARLSPQLLVFQTLTHGAEEVAPAAADDFGFADRGRMDEPGWPKLAFIEGSFADDPTNWWAPNHAAVLGMLRSAGFEVVSRPGHEIYLCRHGGTGPGTGFQTEATAAAAALQRTEKVE